MITYLGMTQYPYGDTKERYRADSMEEYETAHPDHDKPHDWYQTYVVTRCKNADGSVEFEVIQPYLD